MHGSTLRFGIEAGPTFSPSALTSIGAHWGLQSEKVCQSARTGFLVHSGDRSNQQTQTLPEHLIEVLRRTRPTSGILPSRSNPDA